MLLAQWLLVEQAQVYHELDWGGKNLKEQKLHKTQNKEYLLRVYW